MPRLTVEIPIVVGELPGGAEVDEADHSRLGGDEDVRRVRVGVEEAVAENHLEEHLAGGFDQGDRVDAHGGDGAARVGRNVPVMAQDAH